jgi:hypothetical protein
MSRLESQFAQYSVRYGGANSALIESVSTAATSDRNHVVSLLTYITGHLLVNAILRFPGPLIDEQALCAYLAVDPAELPKFRQKFDAATYKGPFAGMKPLLWTHIVDDVLAGADDGISDDDNFTSTGAHNRKRLEILLNTELARHRQCEERCHGEEGGFLCPFTKRPVCQRADCSVVSNVWIPAGAQLARFEKGFYDEWSPILGM